MNEGNAKINWLFDAVRFLLEQDQSINKEKDKLLDNADRIELDFTKDLLENKTENVLGGGGY